jgi:hypothetical protein
MRKVTLFVLTLSLLLVAGSCKLFSPVDYSVAITVNGLVKDQTGTPVNAATVVLTGANGTQVANTDQYGVYHFADVKAGKYSLSFDATDCARVNSEQLTVDNSGSLVSSLNITTYEYSENLNVILYKEDASLTGSVFYGEGKAAVGAVVKAYFKYGATMTASRAFADAVGSDEVYEAIVAADGSFSFSSDNVPPNGLPIVSAISVYVEQYTPLVGTPPAPGPVSYAGQIIPASATVDPFDFSTTDGQRVPAITLVKENSEPLCRTQDLSQVFSPNSGTIQLDFSRAIAHGGSSFSLWTTVGSPVQYCILNPAWATGDLSVTLKPAKELALDSTYTLDYTVLDAADPENTSSRSDLSLKTISKIKIVSTNVDSTYDNVGGRVFAELDIAGNLTFSFSTDVAKVTNVVLNSPYDTGVVRGFTITSTGQVVTLDPSSDLLPGIPYTVSITAISGNLAEDADSTVVTRTFNSSGAVTLVKAESFQLDTANPTADFSTTSLDFIFTEPAYARNYEIYARYYDAADTTQWQLVGKATSQHKDYYDPTSTLWNGITATLEAPYFDPYLDDFDLSSNPIVTPWVGVPGSANGRRIEFKLTSYDAKGNSIDSTLVDAAGAPQAYVADTIAPPGGALTQTGGWAWAASAGLAAARTTTFTLGNILEYINKPIAANISFVGFGTQPADPIPVAGTPAWSVANEPTNATFTVTFPPNCVLTSGTSTIRINISDLSGNPVQITLSVP